MRLLKGCILYDGEVQKTEIALGEILFSSFYTKKQKFNCVDNDFDTEGTDVNSTRCDLQYPHYPWLALKQTLFPEV